MEHLKPNSSRSNHRSKTSGLARWLCLAALAMALLCLLAVLIGALGTRLSWWTYRISLGMLAGVFWLALLASLIGIVGAALAASRKASTGAALAGILGVLIALTMVYSPWKMRDTALRLPPIHDLSTDLDDPPKFDRVKALRGPDDHPVAYDGPEVATLQRKAYPQLAPLITPATRHHAFAAVSAVLAEMGLQIVASDATQGRLEAIATSRLYGFKDDVVVRILANGLGSRIDIRSKSRVGRHDLGVNAQRIDEILLRLRSTLLSVVVPPPPAPGW